MDSRSEETTDLMPGSGSGTAQPSGRGAPTSGPTATARPEVPTATINATTATDDANATDRMSSSGSMNSGGPRISLGENAQSGVLRPGTVIRERFEIIEKLGSGGMGIVYKALDRNKEKFRDRNPYVAIKVLGENVRDRSNALIALQREATRAQGLAHPNIVTVYDFDTYGDTLFVSMELLEGQSLDKFIKSVRGIGMSIKQALPIIGGMAAALGHAHSKGVVHCDFKPGNVYLTERDEVKVLDFGIARVVERKEAELDATFDAGMLNALTPAYASCEMLDRRPPDPRDDIYALACVTYELVAGKHPYNRYPATQARTIRMVPDRPPGLSRRQWDALKSGLAFDGALRPASTAEFMRGLRDERSGTARPAFWFALTGAIVFAIGATFLLTQTFSKTETAGVVAPVTPSRELTDADREKIGRLLDVAGIELESGFVFSPPGNNALETLLQVVEIDPSNPQARDSLKRVAARISGEAQMLLAKGESAAAADLVTLGLGADPANADLQQLQQVLANK
jgi:serine/threonine protein kinase